MAVALSLLVTLEFVNHISDVKGYSNGQIILRKNILLVMTFDRFGGS